MNKHYVFLAQVPGVRLDRFVGESCPELSRTHAQKLIVEGYVTVNGQPAKASLKLNAGDKIEVTIPPEPASDIAPEDIPMEILFEDEDLLVVNKPAGMAVHPAPGSPAHTLVNAVLAYLPGLAADEDAAKGTARASRSAAMPP